MVTFLGSIVNYYLHQKFCSLITRNFFCLYRVTVCATSSLKEIVAWVYLSVKIGIVLKEM